MPVFNECHYEPLSAEDEIRLIVLDPATREEDPLSCSIIQRRRSTKTTDYFAVSYVWGEPVFSQNLEIRCDDDISYIRITPNVDALLRRLRALDILHCLWIDAVCLNQADEMEKAQQIPMMGRIFGEAKGAHIWLGPEDHMTAKLFTFIREANLLPEVAKVEMSKQMAALMKTLFGEGLHALRVFDDFSNRPWFSRRWIIQEACLARQATVYCGSHSVPLSSLVLAAVRFQTLDMSSYPIKVMANLRNPTTKLTLLELLWNFQESHCLEPKDRVAALLGLVHDNHQFHLDYTAHWAEVYKQVAASSFSFGDNDTRLQVMLHLFEFGAVSVPEDTTYPSWVPDWSKSRQRDLPYHSFFRNIDTYEPYPDYPGYSDQATLTFHSDGLRAHWRSPFSEPRSQQVIFVARYNSSAKYEEQNMQRVINTLHLLFPPSPNSTQRILAFSSLLKTVIKFLQSGRDVKTKNLSCDTLIRNFTERLPESCRAEAFNSLRPLDYVLAHFCIFELESVGPRGEVSTGYGVSSPQMQIQIGDVVIPLWNMEWKYDRYTSYINSGETTTTVLVVRRVKEPSPQETTGPSSKRREVETGRIVGWAVCVILDNQPSHGDGLSVHTKWEDYLYRVQRCQMRLI
ncbi:HET-domain-containing protein [Hypoxylon rubiginosum]|uniref:HET-domain-containing protein n=1 Tax=Hypoxylon rubiginosum TaxID=110542 RepID=A0ACB9YQ31_9PEZI|nr:HET-domain-containing protein [Hypoxylon rubiginosum]